MKAFSLLAPFCATASFILHVASAEPTDVIVERGPFHNVVETHAAAIDSKGATNIITNTYVHLEIGLNRQDKNGNWIASSDQIELFDGGAVARRGQHQVTFAPNLNDEWPIGVVGPDGQQLRSRAVALAYFDAASGKSVIIAEVKDSKGYMLGRNQIVYFDAFDDVSADVRYTYTIGSFEQDVLLREAPPAPESFGLSSETSRLEVLTEFAEPPAPARKINWQRSSHNSGVAKMALPSFEDEQLSFGEMTFVEGKAFTLANDGDTKKAVAKSWQRLGDRAFLVESVELHSITGNLDTLPRAVVSSDRLARRVVTSGRAAPSIKKSNFRSDKITYLAGNKELAGRLDSSAYVVDYVVMPTSPINYTFRADTTYLINGPINLNTTPNSSITFEGGTVIKFAPGVGAALNVNGPVTWLGSATQPVVLTARDDSSIGDIIGNGVLTGYYAETALNLNGPPGTSYNITGVRILHAKNGIVLNRATSHQFTHFQACHCQNVVSSAGPSFSVRNALMANVESCFVSTAPAGAVPSCQIQHLTVDGATWLNKDQALSISYVNSLLVGILNTLIGVGASSVVVPSANGIFQNVIGGGHYLANSTYRNVGVTTIDADLRKDFQRMTTYPPIVVAGAYTRNTTLWPRQLGDSDVPDYGYHYPVADYVWSGAHIQNCAVTLANGVAVALSEPIGVTLESGAALISQGLPAQLNAIYRVEAIQELAPSSGKPINFISDSGNVPVWPSVSLRFTELSGMAGSAGRYVAGNLSSPRWSSFTMRDCRFENITLAFWPNTYVPGGPGSVTASVQNNLFSRSRLSIYKSYGSANSALIAVIRNNLFRNSALNLVYDNGIVNPTWSVYDNLFDHSNAMPYGGLKQTITYGFNGFFRSTVGGGPSNKILTNLVYAAGKLGPFYYSLSAGDANSLIHAGSQSAAAAGLFHYTVKPSADGIVDVKEAMEFPDPVSIGFHYVAVDSGSTFADADGDLLPDYLEDADGNGIQNGAETDWRLSDAPYYSDYETLGPSSHRTPLMISEIMYHPTSSSLQFIELYNSDPWELDISNYQLRVDGVLYATIPPGQKLGGRRFLVVAQNPAAVQNAYGISGVLGWNPLLDLSYQSADIQIFNGHGGLILEVEYSDESPWPVQADGAGHSLVLARPSYGEKDPRAWGASDLIGGSPGTFDSAPSIMSEPRRVVTINEFLANPTANASDFIELYNHSNAAFDVGGCYLSDDAADLTKFAIPAGTTIPAHGFIAFKRNAVRSFTFNVGSSGGKLFLTNPARTRVIDACSYKTQPIGISLGRYPDGSSEWRALAAQSPGAANSEPIADPVIISEIMFKPISGNDSDQFLELYNRSGTSVSLNGWSFEGINYRFSSFTLASNSSVVVCRNATNMFAKYPTLNSGNTFQWTSGALKRSGERIRLLRADGSIANEVTYDGSWGKWANGGGSSLELVDLHADNRRGMNWTDSDDRSKAQWTSFSIPALGQVWSLPSNVPAPAARNWLEVFADGPGEFFIDDVALTSAGVNKVVNGTFNGGNVSGWSFYGSHRAYEAQSDALLLKPDQRGDTGPNCARADLSGTPASGAAANITARVKWQRGNPNVVFRGHGGYLELEANLAVPPNLGSPGLPNTVQVANLGPAVWDYSHRPVLPQANQPVVVTARVADPDGIYSVKLKYRIDPSAIYSSVAMLDNGTRGDAVAGDGIYSAAIPGQPANSMVAFYIEATDSAVNKATSVVPASAPAKECLIRFGEPLVGPGFAGSYTFPSYRMWMTAAIRDNWHNLSNGVPRMNKSHQDMTFVYGNQRVIYNAGAAWSGGFYSSGFMDYNRPDDHTCGYELDFPLNQKFLGSDEAVFDWPVWGQKNTGPTQRAGQYEQIGLWLAEQFGIQSMNRRFFHLFVNGVHQSSRPLMQKTYWGFPDHNYDWVEASLGAKIYEDIQQPGSDFVSEWFPNDSKGELYKIAEWFEYPGANPDVEISPSDRHWPVIDNYSRKKSVYRFWWEKRANGISMDYSKLYALFDSFLLPRSDEYTQAVYNWEVGSEVDIEQWMKVFAFEDSIGDYDSFGNGWKNSYLYKPTKDKWKVLIWDLDASLGDYATWGPSTPTDPPIITAGPLIDAFQIVPLVRRAYWRQLKSQTAAGGPMDNAALAAQIDGRQAAFQADQIKAGELAGVPDSLIDAKRDAAAIKSWIASRRTFLATKIPAASFVITSAGGSTSQNPFPVQGSAPVDVTRITVSVNGGGDIDYPITWGPSRETSWKTGVRLDPGVATTLTFKGFNSTGTQLGSSSLSVTYSGTIRYPATGIVINEHMVNNTSFLADPNALSPYGPWLELHNTTVLPFDLSNYGLSDDASNKSKFVFPTNTLVPPGGFLLVWVDNQNTPPGESDIHCNTFSMTNPGVGTTASIYLYTPDTGQLVDSDSYSTQPPNVSRRRLPNAAGPLSNGNSGSPGTPRRYNR